jgi:hypothetical protein
MRNHVFATLAIGGALAVGAGGALAGGGPEPGVMQGGRGIEHGSIRYVAVSAGARTVIEEIRRSDAMVVRFSSLKGNWGVPIVAFDGTTGGLLPSGHMLVLGEVSARAGLRTRSSFALIDTRNLRLVRTIRLAGDFSFDALAPDGSYLYLIEHVSSRVLSRYRVRAYDLGARKLLARVIVDKREWEPTMRGWPVTRANSTDGSWVYTLYGGTGKSFIHALDARGAGAVCVDLPWPKQPGRLYELKLALRDDGHLVVRGPNGRTLAIVDHKTFRVLSSVSDP